MANKPTSQPCNEILFLCYQGLERWLRDQWLPGFQMFFNNNKLFQAKLFIPPTGLAFIFLLLPYSAFSRRTLYTNTTCRKKIIFKPTGIFNKKRTFSLVLPIYIFFLFVCFLPLLIKRFLKSVYCVALLNDILDGIRYSPNDFGLSLCYQL